MAGIVKAPVNPIQPEKAPSPIFVTVAGIGRFATVRAVQPLNMYSPIVVMLLPSETFAKDLQPLNKPGPIRRLLLLGIVKSVRPEPAKA